jgi:hypothetical protein
MAIEISCLVAATNQVCHRRREFSQDYPLSANFPNGATNRLFHPTAIGQASCLADNKTIT